MDLDQIQIVLVLADELHFGRTAERLHLSQSRVSKQVAAVERELGGALFDRSGRQVRTTPLGQRFVSTLGPAYRSLLESVDRLKHPAEPRLRVGFVPTTGGAALGRVVREFERRHPGIDVVLKQVSYDDPYADLRRGDVDVLAFWHTRPEHGVTVGPTIDRQERVAMMSAEHRLAGRDTVSVLDVDNWAQATNIVTPTVLSLFLPPTTADGTPIQRSELTFTNLPELIALVAGNRIAHATVASISEIVHRDDIALVPIRDLPPIDLAVLWLTAHETELVRGFARVARELSPFSAPGPSESVRHR